MIFLIDAACGRVIFLHRIVLTYGSRDCVRDELGEVKGFWLWRFLFGFCVANLFFRRCVAFLFRVAAAYVIGGEKFGCLSTLGSGAVFGG